MIDRARARVWLAAPMLVGFTGCAHMASVQPVPLNARVVWVREERVVIASPDSLAVEPGTLLTFRLRGRQLALGEVSRVYEGELAVARLTSGSLRGVSQPERLQVLAQSPPLHAAPLLRVGYPAGGRSNLLFGCDQVALRAQLPVAYDIAVVTGRSFRLVRDPGRPAPAAPWPDTLLVRLFDEVADEEIALERGEIDVAVFWPGEPSAHLRGLPRWQGFSAGTRARGIVAALPPAGDAPGDSSAVAFPDSLAFAALNQELFRGDLDPWGAVAASAARSAPASGARQAARVRYEVDASCPGRPLLERFLNRGAPAAPDRTPVVRVFYLDAPIHEPDSLSRGLADYARDGVVAPASGDPAMGPSRAAILFAVRCPIVCAPELRPYVNALGTDALVNLLDCRMESHRR